jgi:hypothetical protein
LFTPFNKIVFLHSKKYISTSEGLSGKTADFRQARDDKRDMRGQWLRANIF